MSGAVNRSRAIVVGTGLLKLPRASARGTEINVINDGFAAIEQADSGNVKKGREPQFPSILLAADDGTTWRLKAVPNGDGTASLTLKLVGR
jgi:hypothetical protein